MKSHPEENAGPDAAPAELGVQKALPVTELAAQMPKLLENRSTVWYPFATHRSWVAATCTVARISRARTGFSVGLTAGPHIRLRAEGAPTASAPGRGVRTRPPTAAPGP